jgi:acyl-CoA synthetase (AMP-forming)/AMP-acid ligase II
VNPAGNPTWQSWQDLYARAMAYGVRLSDAGVRRGDVCVLVLPSDEHCATALLSTLFLGARPLLVAPVTLQGTRSSLLDILRHTLRRTEARAAVCDESMAPLEEQIAAGARKTTLLFGTGGADGSGTGNRARVTPAPTDLAALQLTSGTTGFPRICVWRHRGVLAALDAMWPAMGLSRDDVCLNWTPLYHDMGLVNNFLLCLTSGVPLVMMNPHDFVKQPALWLRALHTTGATVTWSPNFGFALAAKLARADDLEGVRLDHVRAFWNAAERIHHETMVRFHERFAPYGVRREALKTNFGCAENVGGATFSDLRGTFAAERVDRDALYLEGVAHPVPEESDRPAVTIVGAGRASPGVRIAILSPRGKSLPDGHVGEVALETPSRMDAYLGDAAATRRAMFGPLLRTGDLAYLREGELFWVGRVRERITIRGKKLDPSELEPVLLRMPELRPGCFVAFGVDDADRGTQRLVVVSELQDRARAQVEDVRRRVRAAVMLEAGVEASDVVLVPKGALTKTSSGKRRHRHFKGLYLAGELRDVAVGGTGSGSGGPAAERSDPIRKRRRME